LTSESLSDVKCRCGGRLKSSFTEVEFFGINFGLRRANVCSDCGSEYLAQEVMEKIELEVKRRKLFGLERRGAWLNQVTPWLFGSPGK